MQIIIDIDNILWHFAPVFYEHLKQVNPLVPLPSHWTKWDFWKPYFTKEDFYRIVHTIHAKQLEFEPFPDAGEFLQTLKNYGFQITIASHRAPEHAFVTEKWLQKHGLVYDELHLSYDKTLLLNGNILAVVDDCPKVILAATEKNILAFTIDYPWVGCFKGNEKVFVADSLDKISQVIRNII